MTVAHWVVLNADGSVNCQPAIRGKATPAESGDNPAGLRQFRVARHGDLQHEHFDAAQRCWVSDEARRLAAERRARLDAATGDELVDHIVEEVLARLRSAGLPI